MRQATAKEKADLVRRFQVYLEKEIAGGGEPTLHGFMGGVGSLPFRASPRSLRRWYVVYRNGGEQALRGKAGRRGPLPLFERHPQLAKETMTILSANQLLSAESVRQELRRRIPDVEAGHASVKRYLAALRRQRIVNPLAKAKNRYFPRHG